MKPTFTFGRNWRRFLKCYTPERQRISQEALLKFLDLPDLKGKTFLDIGSGSGIHSAAAFLAGAKHVHSFDYDADSVMATRMLHEWLGAPTNWTIEQGSVLDDDYIASLGTFDVVYSWGVLHHTGNQWHAIENAARCMHATSLMFIALYAKEVYYEWEYWERVKRAYNERGAFGKWIMECKHLWIHVLDESWLKLLKLPYMIYDYRRSRGMALWSDIRDWLGGWPTEFSSVPEICAFAKEKLGASVTKITLGEGNTEFLLMKTPYARERGIVPLDEQGLLCFVPVLSHRTVGALIEPVWIFGAAKGGEKVHAYLTQQGVTVAGFIDITPRQETLFDLPIVAYDVFAAQQPKTVPVIIASQYLEANFEKLKASGFTNIFDAFTWIQRTAAIKPSLI